MANNPTIGVFIPSTYLNTVNVTSQFGQQDSYGNVYPSGLTVGKTIEIGDLTAQNLSSPASANVLFGGSYQFIQVDSGATAAYVQAGRGAFLKLDPGGTAGVQPEQGFVNMTVTSQDQADANTLFAGVFINAITPGNFGFIFVGNGRVEVTYKSSLTNGSPAIGDVINVFASANGLFDDNSASTWSALSIGIAVTAPVANGTSAIWVPENFARIPQV